MCWPLMHDWYPWTPQKVTHLMEKMGDPTTFIGSQVTMVRRCEKCGVLQFKIVNAGDLRGREKDFLSLDADTDFSAGLQVIDGGRR